MNEKEKNIQKAEIAMKRERQKIERNEEIKRGFRIVFYRPLSIAFKVISLISKMIGSVTSIGIPFGAYSIYKVISSFNNGIPFTEIKELKYVFFFIVIPSVSFLIHFVADKFQSYFYHNSL